MKGNKKNSGKQIFVDSYYSITTCHCEVLGTDGDGKYFGYIVLHIHIFHIHLTCTWKDEVTSKTF